MTAELHHVLTLPDFERAGAIQSCWRNPGPARSASSLSMQSVLDTAAVLVSTPGEAEG